MPTLLAFRTVNDPSGGFTPEAFRSRVLSSSQAHGGVEPVKLLGNEEIHWTDVLGGAGCVARALLARLQDKVAVFEWHRRQQTRGDVRWTIEEVLNELPEEPYPKDLWDEKVEATWQFVFGHPDWRPGQAARLH